MTREDNQIGKIPNFWTAIIIHSFFGVLEYLLILIALFYYISNIAFLIISIGIISVLFMVLVYTLLFKNPYYYIACVGLICITVIPSAIQLIIFIGSTTWSYEPIKIFTIAALIIETIYIFVLIREVSYNKYISYFHDIYTIGYPIRKGTTLLGKPYSVKDFDKLDKGTQYWQDRDPEEVKHVKEEIKKFKKKHKKRILIGVQTLGFALFNAMFYSALAF